MECTDIVAYNMQDSVKPFQASDAAWGQPWNVLIRLH